jgi:hypothetical protein
VVVLDIVVSVEIAEEMVQPRREERGKFLRVLAALAIVADRRGQQSAHVAEHVVPLQPEPRHAADVVMRLPLTARILFDEIPQVVGQPGAGFQMEWVFGHVGILW